MPRTLRWHGTEQEARELLAIVAQHCACVWSGPLRRSCCASHQLLIQDQRVLDGLIFARRLADRLRREEWARASSPFEQRPDVTA
jgi:hypothetical protein